MGKEKIPIENLNVKLVLADQYSLAGALPSSLFLEHA